MAAPNSFDLEIALQPSFIANKKFVEYVLPHELQQLLDSEHIKTKWDTQKYSQEKAALFYRNEKEQLENYQSLYNKKLKGFLVRYGKAKHGWGRVFPYKSLGLTCFAKYTRNSLIRETYYDYDLANAQPEIVRNLCRQEGFPINYDIITQYCNEREGIINQIMEASVGKATYKQVKTLMITLSFFGGFEGWLKKHNIPDFPEPVIVKHYRQQIALIAKLFAAKNPEMFKTIQRQKIDQRNSKVLKEGEVAKEPNVYGAFFSTFLQEYELRIVEAVLAHLCDTTRLCAGAFGIVLPINVYNAIYEYDGIKLWKANVEAYAGGTQSVLALMNNHLKELGWDMRFEMKDITNHYPIVFISPPPEIIIDREELKERQRVLKEQEKEEKKRAKEDEAERKKVADRVLLINQIGAKGYNIIEDDYEACCVLKKQFEKNIIRSSDFWYVNVPKTTNWQQGEEFVKNIIMTNKFVKMGQDIIPYGANAVGSSNIFKALTAAHNLFPVHSTFVDDINMKTKGRLYFQDKYWDFIKKAWFPIDDVIPLVYIKRLAPTFDFTAEEIAEFKAKVLNMFAIETDRDLYLHAMSRGLAGFTEDKKFYIMRGVRHSGKGVLQEMCFAAFAEYCCVFDIPMSKTNHSGDSSDNRWVITQNCHIKRVGFTNETKDVAGKTQLTLDGNVMKGIIASGGDSFLARNHYQGEISVKNNTTCFMSLNHIPSSKPADAMENMVLFDMPYKFVPKDEVADDIMYREGDPSLKSQIKENKRWADIFIYLLTEGFKNKPVEFSSMNELNQAETMVVRKDADALNPVALFNKAFVKDENGWVSTADIRKVLPITRFSDVKFGAFLKDRGFIQKKGALTNKLDEHGQVMRNEQGKEIKYQPYGYSGLSFKMEEED
jgi:hypothetical protein